MKIAGTSTTGGPRDITQAKPYGGRTVTVNAQAVTQLKRLDPSDLPTCDFTVDVTEGEEPLDVLFTAVITGVWTSAEFLSTAGVVTAGESIVTPDSPATTLTLDPPGGVGGTWDFDMVVQTPAGVVVVQKPGLITTTGPS